MCNCAIDSDIILYATLLRFDGRSGGRLLHPNHGISDYNGCMGHGCRDRFGGEGLTSRTSCIPTRVDTVDEHVNSYTSKSSWHDCTPTSFHHKHTIYNLNYSLRTCWPLAACRHHQHTGSPPQQAAEIRPSSIVHRRIAGHCTTYSRKLGVAWNVGLTMAQPIVRWCLVIKGTTCKKNNLVGF